MQTFTIKRGDLHPPLRLQLIQNRQPIQLAGCTVRLDMARSGVLKVSANFTVVSEAEGRVEYQWAEGDTDEAGEYHAEAVVVFPDQTTMTVPTSGDFAVLVNERLGP